MRFKGFFILIITLAGLPFFAQTNQPELNSVKVKMYTPYMAARHGGPEGLEKFRISSRHNYLREMWYFTESFYIGRNRLQSGIVLDESVIDISRFEQYRKNNEEVAVELPGYKDVIVLLPGNKLIYNPNFGR